MKKARYHIPGYFFGLINKIKITKATIGKVWDAGLKDASDMGRTMAPAAAFTLIQHFKDFDIDENDYDLIITGDLSFYGSKVFLDILKELDFLFATINNLSETF